MASTDAPSGDDAIVAAVIQHQPATIAEIQAVLGVTWSARTTLRNRIYRLIENGVLIEDEARPMRVMVNDLEPEKLREPTPLTMLRRVARALDGVRDFHSIGFDIGGMETEIRCALAIAEADGDTLLVEEGWWHPNVRSGQIHDHPVEPGRGWSTASHRLCEPVFTRRSSRG